MTAGGSITTMTYLGSIRVIPNYNVMGVAKAALEASVRYLASELGPANIRVNAISAGAVKTASARVIKDLSKMMRAPPGTLPYAAIPIQQKWRTPPCFSPATSAAALPATSSMWMPAIKSWVYKRFVTEISMIKVEGLTKRYARTTAVDHISFEVQKGQIVGFLGPNGAGKTTTMRCLTCFMPPTSGTASVAGFDVLEHPMEVKKRIGYLPETPPLYPDMEVHEYLISLAA